MNTNLGGSSQPHGDVSQRVSRDLGDLGLRKPPTWSLRNFIRYRRRELPSQVALAMFGRIHGITVTKSQLSGVVYRADPALKEHPERWLRLQELLRQNFDVRELSRHFGGQVLDYGVLSHRLVTTVGVGFIVDAFQNLVELEDMKYHGYGTGTTAENAGDTALVTELTTEYVTNNTRPTGSQGEGASANIYRTTGTLSPDTGGTLAITEHGIFNQASNAGGVLLDRSVFAAVNLVAGQDSLQTQYDLTLTAGG